MAVKRMDSLSHITHAALRRATDERSWARGEQYFRDGHVVDLVMDQEELFAKVVGQSTYQVRLWVEDDQPEGECTCPVGAEGAFCKHCVAVGLAYLDAESAGECSASAKPRAGKARRRTRVATMDEIREHLRQQPVSRLVDLLIQQAREDDRLRDRLQLAVARQRKGGPDVDAYRQAIDEAMSSHGFVDYYAAAGFARDIDTAVDAVAELLAEGHAQAVIELAEHALQRWEEVIEEVDDSNGEMRPIQERLIDLHHQACLQAQPDPVELARRLFEWEVNTDWDTFYGAAAAYADVLGERGLAEYRRLAERVWVKLPECKPGSDRFRFDGDRFRITSIMESLARVSGDVDELVAIKRKDLSSPYAFLQIAQILVEAGRADEALAWAERGQKAFRDSPDTRLEEFLIEQYRQRGRDEDALALRWSQFERQPSLQDYQNLHEMAAAVGQWEPWRGKAQKLLRQGAESDKRRRPDWSEDGLHQVLVRVLLWEGRTDEAWEQAHRGQCSRRLWRELAEARAQTHPADAAEVLGSQVDPIVQQTNNEAYAEAVRLIRQVRKLMHKTGEQEQYKAWLGELRQRHRRKRNFMAMLDKLPST